MENSAATASTHTSSFMNERSVACGDLYFRLPSALGPGRCNCPPGPISTPGGLAGTTMCALAVLTSSGRDKDTTSLPGLVGVWRLIEWQGGLLGSCWEETQLELGKDVHGADSAHERSSDVAHRTQWHGGSG